MDNPLQVVWLLGVCGLILVSSAEPILQIFPNRNFLLAPTGTPLALMCKGKDDVDGEFTDMKWFDPNGEEYPESSPYLKKLDSTLTLTFKEPNVTDSGTYKCTALFSHTVTLEQKIKVNFYEPIKFEDCPEVQNLVLGQEGRVQCRVVANPTPIINWEKDQMILQSDRISIDESGIVISSVSLQDAGNYTVEAFVNATGINVIQEIKVNVLTPPKINLSEEFIVIQGQKYTIPCRATGSPPLSYHWYDPNLKDLSHVDGFIVNEELLTITNVSRNDEGEYTCEVKNPYGTDRVKIKIEVQVRPIIAQLDNITCEEGKDALLECRGEGIPRPIMTIRRANLDKYIIDNPDDGFELNVTEEGSYSVLRLRIKNVRRSDSSLYYCKASSDAGVVEKAVHLDVQFRPDLSRTHPTKVMSWAGNPANLTCTADANPNATIRWKFMGDSIEEEDERFRIFGSISYSSLLVLTANRQNFEVYGTYTCEAGNVLGENSINIILDEASAPSRITQIIFDMVTPTSITFRLIRPSNTGGFPIIYYSMKYKLSDQPNDTMYVVEWPKDTPYILDNLIPRAKYDFFAAAGNLVGVGSWISATYIMPEETVPEPPLIKMKPETVSQDAFEVHWDAPSSDNGKPIFKYGIRYYKVDLGLKGWYQIDRTMERSVPAEYRSFKLTGLLPESFYKIEIRAENDIGNSLPDSVVIKTSRGRKVSSACVLLSSWCAAAFLLLLSTRIL